MAAAEKSTIQSVLENVRDACVKFGHRFLPPADERKELTKLLAELGIADPANSVTNALATVTGAWATIANQLSGISLDFTDPAALLAGIKGKADAIRAAVDAITKAPDSALNGLGASGAAIKAVFPRRLLDYVVYEFLTATHEKIAGVFLVLGVLRREFTPAKGNPAFIDAELRIFDLEQFLRAITHPRESFLTTMRWGTNDFVDRPIVDGMALLLGAIPGVSKDPNDDDKLPLADEQKYVAVDGGLRQASRRKITFPPGVTVSFVGLHKHGVGLEVQNPVNFQGNLIPPLPASQIFAITPGAVPASDPPGFVVLP